MYLNIFIGMKKIIIKESQLNQIKNLLTEDKDKDKGSVKDKLFIISTLAHEMFESLENEDEMEDWIKSKISQCEQDIINVIESYFHNETKSSPDIEEKLKDLVIGK